MCGEPGCGAAEALPCAYAERVELACGTSWCAAHGHAVETRWFCPRHGAVVAALATTGDLSAEFHGDPDSLAPTLLLSIGAGVDEGIRSVLDQVSWRWPGSSMLREPLFMRHLRERRERIWEASWMLHDTTGALARVVLELPDQTPWLLGLRVDHRDIATLALDAEAAAASALPAGQPAALPGADLVEAIVAAAAAALGADVALPATPDRREAPGWATDRLAGLNGRLARPLRWPAWATR